MEGFVWVAPIPNPIGLGTNDLQVTPSIVGSLRLGVIPLMRVSTMGEPVVWRMVRNHRHGKIPPIVNFIVALVNGWSVHLEKHHCCSQCYPVTQPTGNVTSDHWQPSLYLAKEG